MHEFAPLPVFPPMEEPFSLRLLLLLSPQWEPFHHREVQVLVQERVVHRRQRRRQVDGRAGGRHNPSANAQHQCKANTHRAYYEQSLNGSAVYHVLEEFRKLPLGSKAEEPSRG
jgi:hypothetical protein